MISLLLPTRQRPDGLIRLANSAVTTADCPELIEVVTYLDDDDQSYDQVCFNLRWIKVHGPRLHGDGLVNLSAKWNQCYNVCNGDIVMHCGDDIVFRTPGWDAIVRDAFDSVPDRILFAHGDDLYNQSIGTHGFISRQWVEAVGFFVPPRYVSDFNDLFLDTVAREIGRHVRLPIITEHMHFLAGKAEIDDNTRERLERHEKHRPQDIYHSEEGQAEIRESIERLRQAMA